MTKVDEAAQYLHENAFISIGVLSAVTLCLALAAVEVQRRRRQSIKKSSAAVSAVGSANGVVLEQNNEEKTD